MRKRSVREKGERKIIMRGRGKGGRKREVEKRRKNNKGRGGRKKKERK